MSHIAVLGAGSWGTALGMVLADNGHTVTVWGRDAAQVADMRATRENKKYLPGVVLPEAIHFVDHLSEIKAVDVILMAVPTQQQRAFIAANLEFFTTHDQALLVNVAKGLEADSGMRLSDMYRALLGDIDARLVVLYGPSHAEEVARRMPTALVAASLDDTAADTVQLLFMCQYMRVYTNSDLIGVELGGALKNIIALAIGMTIGLGYGDNARAALMTRGLAEITRLGVALGASPMTFLGLTGVGDLIVTCTSQHSRNRTAGVRLGEGESVEAVLNGMGMVVEGIPTTQAAHRLAQTLGIEMPIVEHMYRVLNDNKDVHEAAGDLMSRHKKSEIEEFLH